MYAFSPRVLDEVEGLDVLRIARQAAVAARSVDTAGGDALQTPALQHQVRRPTDAS